MHISLHTKSNSETFQEVGKVRLDHSPQINLLLSSQKTTLQQPVSGCHSRRRLKPTSVLAEVEKPLAIWEVR